MNLPRVAMRSCGSAAALTGFSLDTQEGDNWCWAAVSISVARLRGASVVQQQCDLAKHFQPGCTDCTDKTNCDKIGRVSRALTEVFGIDANENSGLPPATEIVCDLKSNKPVVLRVKLDPSVVGTSHYVVICQCIDQTVSLLDPTNKTPVIWEGDWPIRDLIDNCIAHCRLA